MQRCQLFLNALQRHFEVAVLVLPVADTRTYLGQVGPVSAQDDALDLKPLKRVSHRSTHFGLLQRISNPAERAAAFALYGLPSACEGLTEDCLQLCHEALSGQAFDHIHVMRSYCAPFGAALAKRLQASKRTSVLSLDLDEDDAAFFTMLAEHLDEGNSTTDYGLDALWYRQEASAYREIQTTGQTKGLFEFDALFASSDLEARRLTSTIGQKVGVVLNVAHCPIVPPKMRSSGRNLLFVGNFGHIPNADGLRWFVEDVWPLLLGAAAVDDQARARTPNKNLSLTLVGPLSDDQRSLIANHDGIKSMGRVESVLPHYARADLVVAPLRLGAGTRIKLLECARLGVPFVATSLAAEGLGMRAGTHGWFADSAQEFADAIASALDDPAERFKRASVAQEFALSNNVAKAVGAALGEQFRAMHA